ncbi:MAG: DUF2723 domain-containing protein [bacterium]|nr:DUF2723 domain-containing protein [bacterium]
MSKKAGSSYWLIAFLLIFALYLRTTAPSVTGGDSGELIAASWELGAAHPPGYSLYVLLGRIFGFLPLGGVAFRYNLFSAATAAAALFVLGKILADHAVAPVIGCPLLLFLSVSPLVWGTATAAEVYSPFLFILLLSLWVGLKPGVRRCTAGVFLGVLSLELHYMGLASLVAITAYHIRATEWTLRAFLVILLVAALGISLLLVFPLFTCHGPLVNWGDPVSFNNLFALIFRLEYRQVEAVSWTWTGVLEHASLMAGLVLRSLLWVGVVPVIIGLMAWRKQDFKFLCSWITAFLIVVAGIIFYSPPVEAAELKRHVMEVFYVVPLVLLLLPAGVGMTKIAGYRPGYKKTVSILVAILLLAAAWWLGTSEYSIQNRRRDTLVIDYVRNFLLPVSRDSLLLTTGDSLTFPLWYLISAGSLRKSPLLCVSLPSLTYRWYPKQLARHHVEMSKLGGLSRWERSTDYATVLANTIDSFTDVRDSAPVFSSTEIPEQPDTISSYRWGLGRRLVVGGSEEERAIHGDSMDTTIRLWERFQLRALYHPPLASFVDRGLLITYRSFLYNVSTDLIKAERYYDAEAFLNIALSLNSQYSLAWFNLAYLYSRTDRLMKALEAYESAAKDVSLESKARSSRGSILFDLKDLDGAEREYRRALAGDPNSIPALIGLGAIDFSREKWAAARVWWRKALRLEPSNQLVKANLIILENKVGKKGQ